MDCRNSKCGTEPKCLNKCNLGYGIKKNTEKEIKKVVKWLIGIGFTEENAKKRTINELKELIETLEKGV